ncbi:unnamed protein product [Calicophoron daubneyi]|uniref:WDR36/Utp21 N-terminal domain-containing protein n=1 Tax=Calicophoron daubneyi TaxID=300641 RepID=A0AAV2TC30_CALDB
MFKVVFEMQFQPKSFNISVVFCPLGYANKLLLGSLQGPLQLWNVKSQKHVYWFKGFGSAVTCIQQAPAFNVCAIGLDNGRVYLHNIRFDISLMTFSQDGGAVTAIDFRTGM